MLVVLKGDSVEIFRGFISSVRSRKLMNSKSGDFQIVYRMRPTTRGVRSLVIDLEVQRGKEN